MDMGVIVLTVLVLYFGVLLLVSHITTRKETGNKGFFLGNRESPWYVVAFGMIGSSISAVTFISVPGMVVAKDMTYLQMVLGMFFGYSFIALVLLPLYYKLNLTTIYGYLDQRFGKNSYRTGSSFFILSKIMGASARLYLVVLTLYTMVFKAWDIPFFVVALVIIVLIWLYTFRGGIKTIVWTDLLQTTFLLLALGFIIWQIASQLGLNGGSLFRRIFEESHSRIFEFSDWGSTQNFWKQFLNGMMIAIVMNGLDQDMMQKSLSCRSSQEAKKNMITFGAIYIPVNFLFLSLGVLLLIYAAHFQIALPEKGDQILPLIATEHLGIAALIFFTIGVIAAAFSSIDSAIAAITTTVCVDFLGIHKKEEVNGVAIRKRVHIAICLAVFVVLIIINEANQSSIISTIYKIAAYTYGPLLGLFFFGLFSKYRIRDRYAPYVCILAPLLCFGIEFSVTRFTGYRIGDEILLLNGLLTITGLWALRIGRNGISSPSQIGT